MALTVKEPSMDAKQKLFGLIFSPAQSQNLMKWIEEGKLTMKMTFYNIAFNFGPNFGQVVADNMPLSIPKLQSIADADEVSGTDSTLLISTRLKAAKLYKELSAEMKKFGHAEFVEDKEVDYDLPTITGHQSASTPNLQSMPKKGKPLLFDFLGGDPLTTPKESKMVFMDTENSSDPAAFLHTLEKPKPKHQEAKAALSPTAFGISEAVPLKDATTLGQLVNGTSPEAKYYFVAETTGGVKIAVRNRSKHNKISIRAEAPAGIGVMTGNVLKKSGMNKGDGSYYSMHLDCAVTNLDEDGDVAITTIPVGRVLGSFLMGLGLPLKTAILNMSDIPED